MSPCYWRQHWRQRNWRRNDALDRRNGILFVRSSYTRKIDGWLVTRISGRYIWSVSRGIWLKYTYTHSITNDHRMIHEKSRGFEKKKLISRNVLPDHVHYIKKAVAYVSPFQRRVLLRVISPKHHVRRVKRVGRIICIRRIGVWVKSKLFHNETVVKYSRKYAMLCFSTVTRPFEKSVLRVIKAVVMWYVCENFCIAG